MFGIIVSLIIIAVGAVLRFAITQHREPAPSPQSGEGEGGETEEGEAQSGGSTEDVKLPMVGLIVMALGAALLLISIITLIV